MDKHTATEKAYKNGYEQGIKDAVKHGRWEDYAAIKGVVRCSECHDTYIFRVWIDEGKWYYYPNCGAKMDGEA